MISAISEAATWIVETRSKMKDGCDLFVWFCLSGTWLAYWLLFYFTYASHVGTFKLLLTTKSNS